MRLRRTNCQRYPRHARAGAQIQELGCIWQEIPLQKVERFDDEHVKQTLCLAQPCEVQMTLPLEEEFKVRQQTLELRLLDGDDPYRAEAWCPVRYVF